MMNTKELIETNNEKRKKLTKENEAYYSDLLIYVRLKLELSEHATEEVLMEILDHLLEGQAAEKTATEIFGEDPIAYAETIIDELPKEKKRHITSFLFSIAATIIGPILIIRGLLLGILSRFTTVDETIPLTMTAIITLCIIGYVVIVISFIIKRIRYSIVAKSSTVKDSLYAGGVAAIGMGVIIFIMFLLPEWGPTVEFSWGISLISGIIIWAIVHFIKKNKRVSAQ